MHWKGVSNSYNIIYCIVSGEINRKRFVKMRPLCMMLFRKVNYNDGNNNTASFVIDYMQILSAGRENKYFFLTEDQKRLTN